MARDRTPQKNAELESPSNVYRETYISIQNSPNVNLYLTTFALTNGNWDPDAPTKIPTQGYIIPPGQTAEWGNYTSTPFTSVGGTLTLSTGPGTIVVNWNWDYGSNPTGSATSTGTSLQVTTTWANIGTTTATFQISISGQQ